MQIREAHPDFFDEEKCLGILCAAGLNGVSPFGDLASTFSMSPFFLVCLMLPLAMRWLLVNMILLTMSTNSKGGQPLNFNVHNDVALGLRLMWFGVWMHVGPVFA